MVDRTVCIIAVNLHARLAQLDTGEIVPVAVMLDAQGDETDDPTAAVAAVVGPLPGGGWASIDRDAYSIPTIH